MHYEYIFLWNMSYYSEGTRAAHIGVYIRCIYTLTILPHKLQYLTNKTQCSDKTGCYNEHLYVNKILFPNLL